MGGATAGADIAIADDGTIESTGPSGGLADTYASSVAAAAVVTMEHVVSAMAANGDSNARHHHLVALH